MYGAGADSHDHIIDMNKGRHRKPLVAETWQRARDSVPCAHATAAQAMAQSGANRNSFIVVLHALAPSMHHRCSYV